MANKSSKYRRANGICAINAGAVCVEKALEIFKGGECVTAFDAKERNPMNKRKSAWKGAKKSGAKFTRE